MSKALFSFAYEQFDSIATLGEREQFLFAEAEKQLSLAYAPYSHFKVVATAGLANGKWATGTNQENAAYSVCICAERVALALCSTLYPNAPIEVMVISYQNASGKSTLPLSPCGMCRQSLLEVEERQGKPMDIFFAGFQGKVIHVPSAKSLLPFAFTKDFLI